MIHFGKDIRNTGQNPKPVYYEGTSEEWHVDATADTGGSHTIPGRGYLYLCAWCDDAFFARTKAEAEGLFRDHEDAMHRLATRQPEQCTVTDHLDRQCIMRGPHVAHMTRWGEGLNRMQFVWMVGSSPLVTARAPFLLAVQSAATGLRGNHTSASYQEAYEAHDRALVRLAEFDKEHLS